LAATTGKNKSKGIMSPASNKKTKKQSDPPLTKTARRGRAITLTLLALLGVYIIGLVNPITGPALRYPYVTFYCGQKPVIASDFMAKTYKTAEMKGYEVAPFQIFQEKFYCTEEEAQAAGYHK
jgi:hypothetical protein